MDISVEFDLEQVAKGLGLPTNGVVRTVELLDDGNTVPFITRYRKEQTGALDEEQIRLIQVEVGKLRALVERKQAVLKSIQSRGKLTEELARQILAANTPKRLEDLYLPYKPKKQTLATVARQRGLEPLARELLDADPAAANLRERAEAFLSPEIGLESVDDVLAGVGHIVAESFSERAEVRGRLRRIMRQSGRLVCRRAETPKRDAATDESSTATPTTDATASDQITINTPEAVADEASGDVSPIPVHVEATSEPSNVEPSISTAAAVVESTGDADTNADEQLAVSTENAAPVQDQESQPSEPETGSETDAKESAAEPTAIAADGNEETIAVPTAENADADVPQDDESADSNEVASDTVSEVSGDVQVDTAQAPETAEPDGTTPVQQETKADAPTNVVVSPKAGVGGKASSISVRAKERVSKKEKKRKKLEAAFKDYFSYEEAISKLPHHRILAANRGERARILRAKIDVDDAAMLAEAERLLVPEGHPHSEFLSDAVRDAFTRLLVPSLEREIRREMTERAEGHATEVFARNLRKLLLQPPVYGHRVLAIDPGFRSGCKLIALDEIGNVLDKGIIHVIGREERIRQSRTKLVEMVNQHQTSVIAIGNGTACRETEQLVVEVMGDELKDLDIAFVIVNEAGASVYSTSPLGREELPAYDAVLRSAISIGRRLLDPLSELVKINPANIGVGMYQHDVKAKHLRDSLDAVVESCVNYVGVDVNTASPALLRYVSGLNQLTARRICEYREQNGPFQNREQLKLVSGFGEATFVQAAGFLKITNGENPLDATWIHPESYEVARLILDRLGCSDADLDVHASTVESEPGTSWPTESLQQIVAGVSQRRQETSDEPVPSAEESGSTGVEAAAEPAVDEPKDDVAKPVEEPAAFGEATQTEDATPAEDAALAEQATPAEQVTTSDIPGLEQGTDSETQDDSGQTGEQTEVAGPPEPDKAAESDVTRPACHDEGSKQPLQEIIQQVDAVKLSTELEVSSLLLADILSSLARPGRDPREDLPAPVFRRGVVKLEDLEAGMRLTGTVLNVVDFGAFVDIGLADSGLIHISRLADRFVRDPHDVVGVGDIMTVWVMEVDKQRRRVSLTAIEPGTEKPREPRGHSRKPAVKRSGPRRSEGRNVAGRRGGQRGKEQKRSHTVRKPKIVTPISKEMEEGKTPLRSFSDLMQFYEKRQPDEDKKKK